MYTYTVTLYHKKLTTAYKKVSSNKNKAVNKSSFRNATVTCMYKCTLYPVSLEIDHAIHVYMEVPFDNNSVLNYR